MQKFISYQYSESKYQWEYLNHTPTLWQKIREHPGEAGRRFLTARGGGGPEENTVFGGIHRPSAAMSTKIISAQDQDSQHSGLEAAGAHEHHH